MFRVVMTMGVLFAAGCGGFTDSGSGSRTLLVDARAAYALSNDRTDLRVDVEVQSGDADEARVFVTDDESNEEIELLLANNAGIRTARFNGSFSGYRRRLELRVERGDDDLDAQLEGPGRHVIESPSNGSALSLDDVGGSLEISWSVEDGLQADTVSVSLDESSFDATVDEDKGKLDVEREFLSLGDEEVEVRRTNSIELAGGLVGSKFDFSYEVDNEFIIIE